MNRNDRRLLKLAIDREQFAALHVPWASVRRQHIHRRDVLRELLAQLETPKTSGYNRTGGKQT